ncbi:MAG: Glycosyl transferase family 39, partial [Candidatus Woesebacteria bacterium GW2011_GWA1_40_45]
MGKHLSSFLLIFILVFAFILRFYKVSEIPPSLNWDETSIAYNAYSILKTGKDEWGKFLPLHLRAYGEYKLPAQIYASIPGVAIFGLNELGVRITPVVYGTLTVLFLYFLARRLFKNSYIGLVSAFLLAISPWHIQLTRASFESSFSVFWVILGIWFLVKGFEKPKWWIISVIPFAISIYTYNSARIFTPLFLLTIALIFRKEFWLNKKEAVFSALLFFL